MKKRVCESYRKYSVPIMVLSVVILIAGLTHRNAQAKNIEYSPPPYIVSQSQVEKSQITYSKPKPLRPNYQIPLDVKWQDLIWELCQKNDISYELVLSVFYHESAGFKLTAVNRNTDGSVDRGLAAINSYYEDAYKKHAINYSDLPNDAQFDVFNPDHAIRAGIGGLANLRNILRQRGINEEDLVWWTLGSYNRGLDRMTRYVKKNKTIHTDYAEIILRYKANLETKGTFK